MGRTQTEWGTTKLRFSRNSVAWKSQLCCTVTPDTHSLSKWHQISVELASGGHVSNFNKISWAGWRYESANFLHFLILLLAHFVEIAITRVCLLQFSWNLVHLLGVYSEVYRQIPVSNLEWIRSTFKELWTILRKKQSRLLSSLQGKLLWGANWKSVCS